MIQSMTAFARAQNQGDWGSLICEVRSINHRYLELSIRLPERLHVLEVTIREKVRTHITRGKIECLLRYQPNEAMSAELTLNMPMVAALCKANEAIVGLLKSPAAINTMDILQWPGILKMAEMDVENIQHEVIALLEKTIQDLVEARHREGEELTQLFLQRLDSMKNELTNVRERMPTILQAQREKLLSRFREAKLQLDAERLEQELVMFAQKIDITEELERLDTHINEVRRVLKQGGAAGRRLDFLMQELNREANTLGAKSVDSDTTRASVELKVLIEQMREQVQNIE